MLGDLVGERASEQVSPRLLPKMHRAEYRSSGNIADPFLESDLIYLLLALINGQ